MSSIRRFILTLAPILLLLALLIQTADAQQSLFDEANRLLEENRFDEAIALYRGIADEGYVSGALWLNMGIAYTQMDSLGMAKFYLLKASGERETEQLAQVALDYVNERFTRRSAVLPPLPWDRFFQFLSNQIGITALAVTALLLLNLSTVLLIVAWFRVDLKNLFRIGSATLFGFSILLLLFSFIIHYQENRFSTGIVTDRQSVVYQEPEVSASQITTAFEGFSLRIDHKRSEESTDWFYVRLENGMYGWIPEEGVRIL